MAIEHYIFPMRLDRFVSLAGVAARRKSASLIRNGEISVNGVPALEPGCRVVRLDNVVFAGGRLLLEERHYIMLNKPKGYFCTSADPHAALKAVDLVKLPGVRLFTAGRLDKDSEGLIILTNDGEYAAKLTHPKFGTKKKYEVEVDKYLDDHALEKFRKGIRIDGELLRACDVIRTGKLNYEFIMAEGKKREIRRLVASAGAKVAGLRRTAVGKLYLGGLKTGTWRRLSENEKALSLSNQ